MFKVTPLQILQTDLGSGPCISDGQWVLIYEHFCRQFSVWHKSLEIERHKNPPWELLNNTSGIGCSGPAAIHEDVKRSIAKRLAVILVHAGVASRSGDFLDWLGIKSVADFDTPIKIHGWKPKHFPCNTLFNLRGRWFRKPGPNPSHPPARWVMSSGISFCAYRKTWKFWIEYGYPHDSSHWFKSITQTPREALDLFERRIRQWIDFNLEPDDEGQSVRMCTDRSYDRVHDGAAALFFDDYTTRFEEKLGDALSKKRGTGNSEGRIRITHSRLRTLLRWAKSEPKSTKGAGA